MQRTNIYLERRQTEALDQLASVEGISRAELIRRIVDRAIAGSDDALTSDLAAIDLSFGCMVETGVVETEVDLPVRGSDAREAHLANMWARS